MPIGADEAPVRDAAKKPDITLDNRKLGPLSTKKLKKSEGNAYDRYTR
jgi:hypothetical protein